MICEFGCGQEANYQFKNGRWCCSKFSCQCPSIRKLNSEKNKDINHHMFGKKHSKKSKLKMSISTIGQHVTKETRIKLSKAKIGLNNPMFNKKFSVEHRKKLSNSHQKKILSEDTKNKISKSLLGKKHPLFNKKHSEKSKLKMSISHRPTIDQIKENYPTFAKVEEMRYDPDKPGEKEIQVHCKNHNCKNSKEQGGWFTPVRDNFRLRIYNIENSDGNDCSYLYCSNNCKQECPLFNLRSDPNKVKKQLYNLEEYQTFRQTVLERENYLCEYCEEQANTVHHIMTQKLEPIHVLDPDYGIACCTKCHYKYGHKDECGTGVIASKECV